MICRQCQRRAWSIANRPLRQRTFATSASRFNATVADTTIPPPAAQTPIPTDGPPPAGGAEQSSASTKNKIVSGCPPGTVLTGLNYLKGKKDPVALPDEEYPDWLWKCLDVIKTANAEDGLDGGDEFSKSKKQRREAAKRQRKLEAQLLASGNFEALAPKIPLQQQAINLPGEEGGGLEDALQAAEARANLKRAMRKERRAKIKESNYLKSM